MAQDTSDEQPEKKAAVCECGNVLTPVGEVKKDDIVIVSTDRIEWWILGRQGCFAVRRRMEGGYSSENSNYFEHDGGMTSTSPSRNASDTSGSRDMTTSSTHPLTPLP